MNKRIEILPIEEVAAMVQNFYQVREDAIFFFSGTATKALLEPSGNILLGIFLELPKKLFSLSGQTLSSTKEEPFLRLLLHELKLKKVYTPTKSLRSSCERKRLFFKLQNEKKNIQIDPKFLDL